MLRRALVLAWFVAGCGGSEGDSDGGDTPPGNPPPGETCAPGSLPKEGGGCTAAGIPESGCASGFEWDGDGGCTPILPDEICPPGELALPGDDACHPVATCGSGTWGDIPIEPNTQHVDASYRGSDSDGTAERPWRTLQDAVDAADDSAIVALAAGTYVGHVQVLGKTVRIWGKCPTEVTLEAPSVGLPALDIRGGADGSEIRCLGFGGPGLGLATSASENLLLEQVWFHDTGDLALYVSNALSTASATLRSSLVEGASNFAVIVEGSTLLVEASAVRSTRSNEATLGRGINAYEALDGTRALLTLRGSVVEDNPTIGVYVGASDAVIEGTVVRRQLPDLDGSAGIGLVVEPHLGRRSDVTIHSSVFLENIDLGMLLAGSDIRIQDTAVVRTQPRGDGQFGRGIYVQEDFENGAPATMSLLRSIVDNNHETGVFVIASDVVIESSRMRATSRQLSDDSGGAGLAVLYGPKGQRSADVTLNGCLLDDNASAGIVNYDSKLTVQATAIRGTNALPGEEYGDGIGVVGPDASVSVAGSRIEGSARAAIANFGAVAAVQDSDMACNPIDFDAEHFLGNDARFENLGDNSCGCGETVGECQVTTTQLRAPDPLQTQ